MKKIIVSIFMLFLAITLISCEASGAPMPKVSREDRVSVVTEEMLTDFIGGLPTDDFTAETLKVQFKLDLNVNMTEEFLGQTYQQTVDLKTDLTTFINENSVHAKANLDVSISENQNKGTIKGNAGFYLTNNNAYVDLDLIMREGGLKNEMNGKFKLPTEELEFDDLFNGILDEVDLGDFNLEDILEELLGEFDAEELDGILDFINETEMFVFYQGDDYLALEVNLDLNTIKDFLPEEALTEIDIIKKAQVKFILKVKDDGNFEIGGSIDLNVKEGSNEFKLIASLFIETGLTMPSFPNFNGYVDFDEDIFPALF